MEFPSAFSTTNQRAPFLPIKTVPFGETSQGAGAGTAVYISQLPWGSGGALPAPTADCLPPAGAETLKINTEDISQTGVGKSKQSRAQQSRLAGEGPCFRATSQPRCFMIRLQTAELRPSCAAPMAVLYHS